MKEWINEKNATLTVIVAVVAILLGSCAIGGRNRATVVLQFTEAQSVESKSIAIGGIPTDIATFTIEGYGPSNQSVLQTVDASQTTVTISDLLPGQWTFSIVALNASSQSILSGEATAYLTAGVMGTVSITLSPLPGDGTLLVQFNWPSSLSNPVASLLVDADGDAGPQVPVLDLTASNADPTAATTWDPANGTATFERTVSSGYYYMYTELAEDGAADAPWNGWNHLRVLSGYTTTVTIDVETGDIVIEIIVDRQDPLTVGLAGVENPLTDGSMTVTAQVTETGAFAYSWYLNGASVPSDTGTPEQVTISGLAMGRYRLSVVVAGTDTLGSAWVAFDVIP